MMGDLKNEIANLQSKKVGRRTRIDEIMLSLSPEDAQDLRAALDDMAVPIVSIIRALANRGHKLCQSSVSNYRASL